MTEDKVRRRLCLPTALDLSVGIRILGDRSRLSLLEHGLGLGLFHAFVVLMNIPFCSFSFALFLTFYLFLNIFKMLIVTQWHKSD